MAFLIGEKLDFLMKLTNTPNSALGRALNFDASYISRIRNGKRGMPKHQPFLESASDYFAGRLTEPYQIRAAADRVCPGLSWPESRREAADRIAAWLAQGDEPREEDRVARFLSGFSRLDIPSPGKAREVPVPVDRDERTRFFYGGAGKRQCVEELLSGLCALGTPQTLLLYSDEEMSWLYEDPEFSRRWAALLGRLLSTGSRIRIIHTVSRNAGEMLEAIQKWMPLYMIGTIEPWYYPGERDGLFRRTLFIAQGRAAVVSGSVGECTREKLNLLLRDRQAVAALEREFEDYLALCSPLMEIYATADRKRFLPALLRFGSPPGDLILARSMPSLFTMPEEVAEAVAARCGDGGITERRREAREGILSLLHAGYTVTELLHLPPAGDAEDGRFPLPFGDVPDRTPAFCTRRELQLHLRAVRDMLLTEENYRVVLTGAVPANISIAAADFGVMVARTEQPFRAFHIRERHMNIAFLDYLRHIADTEEKYRPEASGLEAYILSLE